MTTTVADRAETPRREQNKERTRLDLAVAAFTLANSEGLAAVRVPRIASTVGVSTRTFNNYFTGKEQAIAWLAGRHATGMATTLRSRPADEPLGRAVIEAVLAQYRPGRDDGLPAGFLRDFRALMMREPSLYGEYLTAMAAAERDLGDAIAERRADADPLHSRVLAAMAFGVERAAVRHWMETRSGTLVETIREALEQALSGTEQTS
jgi:AcrR family transcriptional regulator